MDRLPQICRPRRGDVHAAGGVGARFPARTARIRPKSVSWRPAHSFVSCDGRTAVNTGPWFGAGRQARRLFHDRVAARRAQDWRWAYDGGGADKGAPAPNSQAGGASRRLRAARRPGAPIIPPPPLSTEAGAHDARGQWPRPVRRQDSRLGLEGRQEGRPQVPRLSVERHALRAGALQRHPARHDRAVRLGAGHLPGDHRSAGLRADLRQPHPRRDGRRIAAQWRSARR